MLKLKDRVKILKELGNSLQKMVEATTFTDLINKAYQHNKWFIPENTKFAAKVWADTLTPENLHRWTSVYQINDNPSEKVIGVINAGNIPFVGMHDLLCVFLAGHKYLGKNASDDPYLLPAIKDIMVDIEPTLKDRIQFEEKISGIDAVIATGSNNSSRYFEYYFGKYPHIIRKNRNAVAVLNGQETDEDFAKLGEDIFRYFGLGCRNISKLYVPQAYDFRKFFEGIESFNIIAQQNKYMNNFDYNNAVFLMKKLPFLQNGFLIVREEKRISSPIAVVHYEQYDSIENLSKSLDEEEQQIQCISTKVPLNLNSTLKNRVLHFGEAQSPALWDYADGVDTIEFLIKSV